MKDLASVRADLRAMLPELRLRYPLASIGVFGSFARGQQSASSDLDLLVEFDGPIGLFAFGELEDEISRRLGLPVEIVTRAALKPLLRDEILDELVPI
ncbi:MAG: nucleotidyltransferase family protein [Geminicoccaceae bacterium]